MYPSLGVTYPNVADSGSKADITRRALIVKFGAIGDVIMAIPAAYSLYQQGFEVEWACGKAVRTLLECYPWIKLVPADDKAILAGSPWSRLREIARLWSRIAFRRYDLCATLYYDSRYRILTAPVRSDRKIALSRSSRDTMIVTGRHHTDEYARVVLGEEDTFRNTSRSPLRPEHLPASPLAPKTGPRVAIVPGGTSNILSKQTWRRWPIEHYVEVTTELLRRNVEVVLLGGPEDTWVRPSFQQLQVMDCIGTLSLPEVISVCDSCDAVISHDTGPMHLAGLSHAALIGIFGPTNPSNFLPRRPSVVGIWGGHGFACRPCYDGRNFAPCTFNGCMHQVTPLAVLQQLDALLQDRAQGRSREWTVVVPEVDRPPIFSSAQNLPVL